MELKLDQGDLFRGRLRVNPYNYRYCQNGLQLFKKKNL